MKAKNLKEAMATVPDDAEVCLDGYNALKKVIVVEYDEYNNRFIIA